MDQPLLRTPVVIDPAYPLTLETNPAAPWTTSGTSTTIESITNLTFMSPTLRRLVSFSICLPFGYTAGAGANTRYPVVFSNHGQTTSGIHSGNTTFSLPWPTAYHDAVTNNFVEPHITVFPNMGENSMGTNCPTNGLMEGVFYDLFFHIHRTYRTRGSRAARYNALMGFSMGARASIYWLFKQAKANYEDSAVPCFGGAAVFGPPLYGPTHAYATDTAIASWTRPCISPSGAYTANELKIWNTKMAQGHVSVPAMEGKLIKVMYGNADPVRIAAGTAWKTFMDGTGIAHQYRADYTTDAGANILHAVPSYWGSGSTNVTREAWGAIQTVFDQTV